jgi:hypothetical protein
MRTRVARPACSAPTWRQAPTATRGSAVDTVIALTHGAARDRYTVLLRLAP